MRNEISALFLNDNGSAHKIYLHRIKGEESDAEFSGRALCRIEDEIRKVMGVDQIPAGTRWAQWENDGHTFGRWTQIGTPYLYTHTGQRYQDRYTFRPLNVRWDVGESAVLAIVEAELSKAG